MYFAGSFGIGARAMLGAQMALAILSCAPAFGRARPPRVVTLTIDSRRPLNRFRPDEALGAGVDGMEHGDIDKVYTGANIAAMLSAGFKPLTYRLRTELGVEAWHWNPAGKFSDPAGRQGYWTSDPSPSSKILTSNGYSLPRRGSTGDQANDRGYSRIDDGNLTTFWKSSPYLDRQYTHEDNALHPQWILIDFDRRVPINAIRVIWGLPYARRYRLEYWRGKDPTDPADLPDHSGWVPFKRGRIEQGAGGGDFHKLADSPVSARWIRILLLESSGAAPAGSIDPRDGMGYAVRELQAGTSDRDGVLADRMAHGKSSRSQTRIYVSSTDPWHRAIDLDKNIEQPGFDRLFHSGLTNGLPVLMPVPILYDTPENAAAEVKWLKARGYPIQQIEMGEEPDGQFMLPEDYAALYLQWADALHAVDPDLQLGGPGFQTVLTGWQCWPDRHGNTSWMNRFLSYLKSHGRLRDFNFFSFEWYPFDAIGKPTAPQLAIAPSLLRNAMALLKKEGLSEKIPKIITEYGYSSFAGEAEVDLPGALLNAEIVGQFLSLGGRAAYLYGYEPNTVIREDAIMQTWGNLALFLSDGDREIRCPLPTFYGAQLLTKFWAMPGHGEHEIYGVSMRGGKKAAQPAVSGYILKRPDGKWAALLINKDPSKAICVRLRFRNAASANPFADAELREYGMEQYAWHAAGAAGYPTRNLPPVARKEVDAGDLVRLPPYSLTVVRSQRVVGGQISEIKLADLSRRRQSAPRSDHVPDFPVADPFRPARGPARRHRFVLDRPHGAAH